MKKLLISLAIALALCVVAAGGSYGQGIDSDTALIIHGNDGDSSGQNHIPAYYGTAKIDASNYISGKGSLKLDGDSDYLSIPDNDDWDVCASNSDDWTIQLWVKHGQVPSSHNFYLSHGSTNFVKFFRHSIGYLGFEIVINSSVIVSMSGDANTDIQDTNWHHLAIVKKGNEWGFYKDGNQIYYDTQTLTGTISANLLIGVWSTPGTTYFNGNIDELIIQKSNLFNASPNAGKTDTLTPPCSTPTADANTKLLLNFEEGDQYGGHDVYPAGGARVDKTTKKWANGSWYFDGTDDYLELADSPDWDICGSTSDDWTIDLWGRHTDHVSDEMYVTQRVDGNNRWFLYHSHGIGLTFIGKTGGTEDIQLFGGEIADTNWHHVAVVKVGSAWGVYKDGVQVSYDTQTAGFTLAQELVVAAERLGVGSYGGFFDGHMDEIRIQHSNIFEASPAQINTKLLLNFEGSDEDTSTTDESSNNFTVTFSGDCEIDDARAKFGSTSLYSNGANGYISVPDDNAWDLFENAVDDYTFEMWVYLTDGTIQQGLIQHNETFMKLWMLYRSLTSNKLVIGLRNNWDNFTWSDTSDTDVTLNAWHHIALIKVGNIIAIYLDGNQDSYKAIDSYNTWAGALYFGTHLNGTYDFKGNFDGIRVSTANIYSASPVVGKTDTITLPASAPASVDDTITVPTREYSSNIPPNTPTIDNFNTGGYTGDNTPALQFDLSDPDAGDTVKFQIQVDDTSGFSSPVVDYTSALAAQANDMTFTVGQAAGGGAYAAGSEGQTLSEISYYWRVRCIDENDVESGWATANGGAVAFIVDTQSPGAPVITWFSYNSSGQIGEVRGTAEANATVYVYDGGSLIGSTTADGSGDWTYTPGTPLSAGPHSISTKAEDGAANQSDNSVNYTVTQSVAENAYQDSTVFHSGAASLRLEKEGSYDFKIAVNDGVTPDPDEPVTLKAWMRKNSDYTGTEPKITLSGLGIDGTGAATASMTAGPNAWEQLTVTGAPDAKGMVTLRAETFSTADGAKAWVDDMSVSQ